MMTMTKALNENINMLTCHLSRMLPLESQHLLRDTTILNINVFHKYGLFGGGGKRGERKWENVLKYEFYFP